MMLLLMVMTLIATLQRKYILTEMRHDNIILDII